MNASPARNQTSQIAYGPLIAVIIGLTMTVAPLFPKMARLGIGLFFAACAARIFMNRSLERLPSTYVKLLLFTTGAIFVAHSYGTVLGIEPGLTLLMLLISLKLLETNNVRDFQIITLLGYFMALCDLFFSQDLILWLYVAAAFTLLTAALIRFHSGWRGMGYGRAARLAATMFLQGLPLVVILFLFFPRSDGGIRFQFGQSASNSTGMSDHLSPGSISKLALDNEVAFRAEFPDSRVPPMVTMYWRCLVLWDGQDLKWRVGHRLSLESPARQLSGPSIRQRISLQPQGERWLCALDRPAASEAHNVGFLPGDCLQSARPITSTFLYEVISRPENRELSLPANQLAASLQKPAHISKAVQSLVNGWRASAADDRELVRLAMSYFRNERFLYTLDPGAYPDENALDEFLFHRRKGFCEHYAAAFATLMRIAGIPSRVVSGYHGGEYNQIGEYVIVRQSDAHAWCEVWLRDRGWLRVDPTDMIAPDRLDSGFASYLEAHPTDPAAARVSTTILGWRQVMREALLAWDSINYQWDLRVLNFDQDNQRDFLNMIGLRDIQWPQILGGAGVAILFLLALLSLLLRRPGRIRGDAVGRCYARFCRAAEAGGIRRESWEGPRDFGERAAAHFPAQADAIRRITSLYIQFRYAAEAPALKDFAKAVRALPKLEERKQ